MGVIHLASEFCMLLNTEREILRLEFTKRYEDITLHHDSCAGS